MSDSDRSDVNDLFAGSGDESSSNEDYAVVNANEDEDYAVVNTKEMMPISKREVAPALEVTNSAARNAMYSPQEEENELQDAEPLIKPGSSSDALKRPDGTNATIFSSTNSAKKSNSRGCACWICCCVLLGVAITIIVGILGIILKPVMSKVETQISGGSHHSPPPFLRNPGNVSVLARHNQSKIHSRRNHSAGSKRMRGNKTAARSPFNGHGGRVRRLRNSSEHAHRARHWKTKWTIVHEHPHDSTAFTEGLEFHNGRLYESTGLYGKSELRMVHVESGRVVRRYKDPKNFGEGCTILNNSVYRLTWKSHKGYVHDAQTLKVIREFDMPNTNRNEGWGLSHIGNTLVMDDGSSDLFFIDPVTMKVIRRVTVHYPEDINDGEEVKELNELEYVHGELLANVWYSDLILRINPDTGVIVGVINLTSIVPQADGVDVLNGIAYNHKNGLLYVTGKMWPSIFAIKVHW